MAGGNLRIQIGREPSQFGSVAHHLDVTHLNFLKFINFLFAKFYWLLTLIIFRTNEHKMVENALSQMLLKLIIDRV
jgi:hypothetical protein